MLSCTIHLVVIQLLILYYFPFTCNCIAHTIFFAINNMRPLGTSTTSGAASSNNQHNNHTSSTIALPKSIADTVGPEVGAQDTIYLCNFRVSVDGEWLCLKELQDLDIKEGGNGSKSSIDAHGTVAKFGIESVRDDGASDNTKNEREWVNYYCRCLFFIEFYFLLFVFVFLIVNKIFLVILSFFIFFFVILYDSINSLRE